ncbi:radical SAM protein [Pseudodesulfovibrio sp. zrk46]|uniref:B12-binding domain-containing radical SAM protein n=1 Tax=Pseudodesulfovibrio sp. zrk46 TaxID=2725288 RepID=UPI00144930A7|nr:radical SAM protein [Pseudodesulfovibrio sp. zrk46]QJB55880.1 radical SAM protein [Pseudodesulfovibrio sp. zrk46]
MKLLFVYPDYNYAPIAPAFVIPVLDKYGIDYDYLDLNQNPDLKGTLRKGDYTHIATTGLVMNYARVEHIFREAKEINPDIGTILGGRISACPMYILDRMPVDFVVIEDADPTMGLLLKAIEQGTDFGKLTNIMYRQENKLVRTEMGKLRPLSNFTPDWEKVNMDFYMSGNFMDSTVRGFPIVIGLGCVGKCTFCAPGARGLRTRPIEDVIEEMKWADNRYDFSYFAFISDTFIPSVTEVERFCEAYKKSGLNKPFVCSLRADYKLEILDLLAGAGCRAIFFGLEQFDDDALKAMCKRLNESTIRAFVERGKNNGIQMVTGAMIGNLGDTPQSIQKTVDFVKETKIPCVYLVPLFVYPGTELYNIAIEKGIIQDETSFCDEMFNNARDLYIDRFRYPNFTSMALPEMQEVYAKADYELARMKIQNFKPAGINIENLTIQCRNCGSEIAFKEMALDFTYCPKCITVNACIFSYGIATFEVYRERLEKAVKSNERIVIAASPDYAKGLMFAAEEMGAASDKLCFIGNDFALERVKTKLSYDDIRSSDRVLLGDIMFRSKVREEALAKGIPPENIINMMPSNYKKQIETLGTISNNTIVLSNVEDARWLGEIVGEELLKKNEPDKRWAIAPSGDFGINICKGFQKVGVKVTLMLDSYKQLQDVGTGIPSLHPNDLTKELADSVFIATPSGRLQDELADVFQGVEGFDQDDILKLNNIYKRCWDQLFN